MQAILDQLSTEVHDEVLRAKALHKPMASRHEAYAVILEELDEVWDLVKLNPAKMNPEELLTWQSDMREELIQTAAMCIRTVADLGLARA